MPKKQARFNKETDLPDWADDVTPAEEVMKKFYAPTGSFKSGPIAISETHTPASSQIIPQEPPSDPQSAPENVVNTEEKTTIRVEDIPQTVASDGQFLAPTAMEVPLLIPPKQSLNVVSPSPTVKENSKSTLPQPKALSAAKSPGRVRNDWEESPLASQILSFEDFASKWKGYLYPGQLAVMRALFALTLDRGTSECFTRYSEIAVSTKMTRRNCINVMNFLVERGFVERVEVRNDATGKGIRLRIHPLPFQ